MEKTRLPLVTLKIIVALLGVFISGLVIMQVTFRFILNSPLPWPEEMARVIFIYLVFIGSGLAMIENEYISIEILDMTIKSTRVKEWLSAFRHLVTLIVMVFVAIGGFQIIPDSIHLRLSATSWPMAVMVVPVVIGALIMASSATYRIAATVGKILFPPYNKSTR
jgi:TRAP-type C4-dicarboxylate transport system permease small subunit